MSESSLCLALSAQMVSQSPAPQCLRAVLLGFLGGAAATVAAIWGTRDRSQWHPSTSRREAVAITPGIAAVVIGVGVLLGLLAAIAPAVWASRSKLVSLLSATAVRGGGRHGRWRRGMVVVQVALSLILLTAGGLVIRSFERLLSANQVSSRRVCSLFESLCHRSLFPKPPLRSRRRTGSCTHWQGFPE